MPGLCLLGSRWAPGTSARLGSPRVELSWLRDGAGLGGVSCYGGLCPPRAGWVDTGRLVFDLPSVPEHYVFRWALFQSPGHLHGSDERLAFRTGGPSDNGSGQGISRC